MIYKKTFSKKSHLRKFVHQGLVPISDVDLFFFLNKGSSTAVCSNIAVCLTELIAEILLLHYTFIWP